MLWGEKNWFEGWRISEWRARKLNCAWSKEEFCDLKLNLNAKFLISSIHVALNLIFAMSIEFWSVFMHHKVIEIAKIHLRRKTAQNYLMHVDEISSGAGNCLTRIERDVHLIISIKKVNWDVFILEFIIDGAIFNFWDKITFLYKKIVVFD